VHGKSAHTSRPELGRSAIRDAIRIIQRLDEYQAELHRRHPNRLMTGPTLTVTMIQGGRTRNAVPDECRMALDFRVVPGMDPAAARAELIDVLRATGVDVSHGDVQLMTPPLSTHPEDPFASTVLEFCRRHGDGHIDAGGEPYGTDAAWMPGGAPAIVLGPGGIETAHAVDEFIEIHQVVACARICADILRHDWSLHASADRASS
jgi:acetylornithine deacetylase/succinyl-diaminopimelate desuccinylase-like protein